MAITGYCDLGIPGQGGIGTTGNPWRIVDFQNLVEGVSENRTLYVRGTGELEDIVRFGADAAGWLLVKPWDLSLYPPWRLKIKTYWLELTNANGLVTVEGGEIAVSSYGIFYFQTLANSYTKFIGCYLNLTGGNGFGLFRFNQAGAGNTIELVGCTVNNTGWFNNYLQPTIYKITDSLVSCVGLDNTIAAGTFVKNSTVISASTPGTFDRDPVVRTNSQFTIASLPVFPAWGADRTSFNSNILSAGITTPPQKGVGYPNYVGYETGLWGTSRTGIGAMDFVPSAALSNFSASTAADGTAVTSSVNLGVLVTNIQADGTDTYFDSTSKIARVDAFYLHEDGRQNLRVIHRVSEGFQASVSWTPGDTRDGTWSKVAIKAFDHENAEVVYDNTSVLSAEALTHASGVMTLNTN